MRTKFQSQQERELICLWAAAVGAIVAMLFVIGGLVGLLQPKTALQWALALPAPIAFVALAFVERYRAERLARWRMARQMARLPDQAGIVISDRPTSPPFQASPDLPDRRRKR